MLFGRRAPSTGAHHRRRPAAPASSEGAGQRPFRQVVNPMLRAGLRRSEVVASEPASYRLPTFSIGALAPGGISPTRRRWPRRWRTRPVWRSSGSCADQHPVEAAATAPSLRAGSRVGGRLAPVGSGGTSESRSAALAAPAVADPGGGHRRQPHGRCPSGSPGDRARLHPLFRQQRLPPFSRVAVL